MKNKLTLLLMACALLVAALQLGCSCGGATGETNKPVPPDLLKHNGPVGGRTGPSSK